MDRIYEKEIGENNDNKYTELYFKARSQGSFGQSLAGLSKSELFEMKAIVERYLMSEIVTCAPYMLRDLREGVRKSIDSIIGKKYNHVPRCIQMIQKLQKELQIVMGEYKPESIESIIHDNYMEDFMTYLSSLDEREKGPNATNLKIRHYVIVGPKQIEPKDDQENKVIISFRMSFAENLAFIKEHINTAVVLNNIRETDERLKREKDKHYS